MREKTDEQRAALEKMLNGFRLTDVLCAGVELGVFEVLEKKPLAAEQVRQKLKTDRRGTEILLNSMAALDLLEKKNGAFRLSPLARRFLVEGSPEYLGNMVMHTANLRHAWLRIPESVRTGAPAPRPEKTAKDRKARTRSFILAMADGSRGQAAQLAAALDLSNVSRVLDVGGGPGTYLFEMVKKKPDITGAVFDLPATLEITWELIAENKLEHAVGTIAGDFNVDELGSGYDLVLLSSIVHIYSTKENARLVKRCFNALNPGGQIVVKEFLLDPGGASPLHAALFSVNMLVNTDGGSAYTEKEIGAWMSAAGLRGIKRTDLPPRSSIMVGFKPGGKKRKRSKA